MVSQRSDGPRPNTLLQLLPGWRRPVVNSVLPVPPVISVSPVMTMEVDYELPLFTVVSVMVRKADYELSELPVTETDFELPELAVTGIGAINNLSVVCVSVLP